MASFDSGYLVAIVRAALSQRALLALLAVDALLILLHVWFIGSHPNEVLPKWTGWFRLSVDRSLGEIFEYLKGIAAGTLLMMLAIRRSPVLIPVALLPFYLVIDNALKIHERLASDLFHGHQNRGELAVGIGIGGLMALAGAIAFLRGNPRERAAIVAVGMAVGLVGGMAIGVDALHALLKGYHFRLGRTLLVLEDGGEMVAQTALVVICLAIYQLGLQQSPAQASSRQTSAPASPGKRQRLRDNPR